MLTRDEILTTLREAKPTLDSFGVGRLWLFGSDDAHERFEGVQAEAQAWFNGLPAADEVMIDGNPVPASAPVGAA